MNWVLTKEEVGMVYDQFLIEVNGYPSGIRNLDAQILIDIWEGGPEPYSQLRKMLTEANDRKQYNLDFKDYLK